MTTWTMDQVGQARSLRAKLWISRESLYQGGDVVTEAARDKVAQHLVHMAHPFAIEIDPGDLEFLTTDDDLHSVALIARWHPTTNGALLVGGPKDGERWAIQRVGKPLRVDVLSSTPWLTESETDAEATMGIHTATYELTGWHETERLWVYTVRP